MKQHQAGRRQVQTTLKDNDGAEHHYVMSVHPTLEALALVDEIMAKAGGPLSDSNGNGDVAMMGGVLRALGTLGFSRMAPRLLVYTSRDGESLTNNLRCYDGNLSELMAAIRWSAEVNLSDFLGGLMQWVADIRDGKPSETTPGMPSENDT